ncbi:protein IN CHLOROPLAST ATPASE BIOGENESIS, chloroplastic-like isoform X3 [Rhodamnia argentea]|uniref:Protein IN CHLOROPLAST ATPASE BIOGENESIS, chloroplastic-like isoform X3 n=1 Tax=Rhodamnia argentea TaxID=178133 RepID=A0A8B8P635_9MYRT|nr:protein IN CHLOROPLAST ATPASE BIOGENESIS, chloroplastic-like isoform X3 [Rhodamnia argentea]
MLCRASRAASRRPPLLLRGGASRLRSCSSVSSSAPDDPVPIPAANTDHMGFIRDVAATQPPKLLPQLLQVLQERVGETIISPGSRKGMVPLAIPLAKSCSGAITALLRWPTAPSGMEMPVVDVDKHGVYLLAKSVDQFIHRILLEEDTLGSLDASNKLLHASAGARRRLYKEGEFTKSKISNLDIYLLKKVGLFPDILERKAMNHFENGDDVSALVTAEFYTKKENFPGFARPFVFNAVLLQKVGHFLEAKDAARGALKLPWWTLGCKYEDVAEIAEWEDEQIERIKEKITERGREEDLMKGKPPAQIALDEAAFLMDLASVKGTWDDSVDRIGKCYEEAGLPDIAQFVRYQE